MSAQNHEKLTFLVQKNDHSGSLNLPCCANTP